MELCSKFGSVANVLLLKSKNQALVQFQDLSSATNLISQSHKFPLTIRTVQVYPQYSNHTEIKSTARPSGDAPSRILLCTILNPYYSITVDVLNTIFGPYEIHPRGTVEKVVVFQKTAGLQALVQFSNSESAAKAKAALDGKNIYSNCCTLQIQYSNLSDLTIRENSELSRDYTNDSLPMRPPVGEGLLRMGDMDGTSRGGLGLMGAGAFGRSGMGPTGAVSGVGAVGVGGERCVLLVSGFPPERVGCEQLFNLFSNYGTIIRIKILFTKANMALIQFAEGSQAAQAMNFLRGVRMSGCSLEINYSKFTAIKEPTHPGSDAKTVNYETSHLNRFSRFGQAAARNLSAPTDVLHISGLAAGTTEEMLQEHLQRAAPVAAVKVFEHQGKLMALAQFESVDNAVETMCLLHNSMLGGKHIRLSFTRNHL